MNTESTRRAFLKKLFTISVFATAAPKLLAQLEPTLLDKGETLQGVYSLNIADYPDLSTLWKTVKLSIYSTSQNKNISVMVTKVPLATYGVDYTAIKDYCPHENGTLSGVNTTTHRFNCNKHTAFFDIQGKHLSGEGNQNLTSYPITFDSASGKLSITVDFNVAGIEDTESLVILKQNCPNPCSDITKIEFGTEKPSNVDIILYDINGKEINTIFSAQNFSGMSTVSINTNQLTNGTYFYKYIVNGKEFATRQLVVTK